jgi:hypothetical protein
MARGCPLPRPETTATPGDRDVSGRDHAVRHLQRDPGSALIEIDGNGQVLCTCAHEVCKASGLALA